MALSVSDVAEGRGGVRKSLGSPDGVENGLWMCYKMGRNDLRGCRSGSGVCTGSL